MSLLQIGDGDQKGSSWYLKGSRRLFYDDMLFIGESKWLGTNGCSDFLCCLVAVQLVTGTTTFAR
jgi:hypothetical protein